MCALCCSHCSWLSTLVHPSCCQAHWSLFSIQVGVICLSNAQSLEQLAVNHQFCFSVSVLIWAIVGMALGQIRSLQNFRFFANGWDLITSAFTLILTSRQSCLVELADHIHVNGLRRTLAPEFCGCFHYLWFLGRTDHKIQLRSLASFR